MVESFGAGVMSALSQFVSSTPDVEHHLLRSVRPDFVDDGELGSFASVTMMAPRPVGAMTGLRRALREIRPDVIHAHSSLAGALVRLAVVRTRARRIIYTPHGFASERLDVGTLARRAFWATEWLLSWNTDVLAACSVREYQIAERGHAGEVVLLPNVAGPGLAEMPRRPKAGRVLGVGRLTAQKDPVYFLKVVEALRAGGVTTDAVWVGDGSPELGEMLTNHGVQVTGWLPRSSALGLLAGAEVYLHTSAWDAGPMTLLESVALGVPSVARRVLSLPGLPEEASADTPEEVAAIVHRLLDDGARAEANLRSWRQAFALHTPEEQRSRLRAIYALPAEDGL